MFFNGEYTPCDCDFKNGEKPVWQLNSSKVTYDKLNKMIYFKNVVLKIMDYPLFYIPYLSTPDPSVKRKNGFLTPSIGYSNRNGLETTIPYYFITEDESWDSTFTNHLKGKNGYINGMTDMILSRIKDLDINNRSQAEKKDTNDEDIKKLLKKMIKQRSESIEIYKKNNRLDLLEIEQGELDVLSEYLPKQLSEEDTKKICEEIIKSSGTSSIKDMGKVMGELKKNHADTIDFSKAGQIIKNLLNSR